MSGIQIPTVNLSNSCFLIVSFRTLSGIQLKLGFPASLVFPITKYRLSKAVFKLWHQQAAVMGRTFNPLCTMPKCTTGFRCATQKNMVCGNIFFNLNQKLSDATLFLCTVFIGGHKNVAQRNLSVFVFNESFYGMKKFML